MTQAEKQAIMKEYATHEGDTGSPEVQSLFLPRESTTSPSISRSITRTITQEEAFLMVGHRRNLLAYLQKIDIERYRAIVHKLGLRK